MEENIIIRTEKIRGISEALKAKNILYISAFYGSGKTVLLVQTAAVAAEEWGRNVIRFDAAYDKWETFAWKLEWIDCENDNVLFMFDSLHAADSVTLGKLSEFLRSLPETAQAILCGRLKVPEKMNGMVLRGDMNILGVDFVMFSKAEITELFWTYEISLRNEDVARKYKLLRVIADEGAPADSMIKTLKPRKDDWLNAVLRLTQHQAGYYPGYMTKQSERPVFTENEMLVWAQLVKGLKNKENAAALGFM